MAKLNTMSNFKSGIQSGTLTFNPSNHAGITSGKMVGIVKKRVVVLDRYPVQSD